MNISDTTGCSVSRNFTISEPAPLTVTTTQTNVLCYGGLTGSIAVNVTGGTAPYSYAWTPSSIPNTPSASNLGRNSYVITVTDKNFCAIPTGVTISEPAAPVTFAPASTHTDVKCRGGNTGVANIVPSGGVAPYSISWEGVNITTTTVSGLVARSYTAKITDSNGCSAQQVYTIAEPASSLSLVPSQYNVPCFGTTRANASAIVSGGTFPYTYAWTSGVSTTNVALNLGPGQYTMNVTDANSCLMSNVFVITSPAAALSVSKSQYNVSCNGLNTGAAYVTPSGGTAPYFYTWNPSSASSTSQAERLPKGDYSVSVTDVNGCPASAQFSISEPAPLVVTKTLTDAMCFDASTGGVHLDVSGGTLGYTYSWSPNISTGHNATGIPAGPYVATVTDANMCKAQIAIDISQAITFLGILVATSDERCNGGTTGFASALPIGGTSPFTFNWIGTVSNKSYVDGLSSGNYSVTVTDGKGCSLSRPFAINQPAPIAPNAVITPPKCASGKNGAITLNPSGGISPYTYVWSTATRGNTVSNLTASQPFVVITDANLCIAVAEFVVTDPAPLVVTYTSKNPATFLSYGSAQVNISGGTPGYSVLWPNGFNGTSLSNLVVGNYSVKVTDSNQCTLNITIAIKAPGALTGAATTTPTTPATATTTAAPTGNTTESPIVSGGGSSNDNLGPILGGVFGGLALIIILVAVLLLAHQRRFIRLGARV